MRARRKNCRRNIADQQHSNAGQRNRSEEHTSELQSPCNLACRLLLEQKTRPSPAGVLSPRPAVASTPAARRPRALLPAGISSRPFLFFNDTATAEIYTLSLHDRLPI